LTGARGVSGSFAAGYLRHASAFSVGNCRGIGNCTGAFAAEVATDLSQRRIQAGDFGMAAAIGLRFAGELRSKIGLLAFQRLRGCIGGTRDTADAGCRSNAAAPCRRRGTLRGRGNGVSFNPLYLLQILHARSTVQHAPRYAVVRNGACGFFRLQGSFFLLFQQRSEQLLTAFFGLLHAQCLNRKRILVGDQRGHFGRPGLDFNLDKIRTFRRGDFNHGHQLGGRFPDLLLLSADQRFSRILFEIAALIKFEVSGDALGRGPGPVQFDFIGDALTVFGCNIGLIDADGINQLDLYRSRCAIKGRAGQLPD
jgi:hypothetical protein